MKFALHIALVLNRQKRAKKQAEINDSIKRF